MPYLPFPSSIIGPRASPPPTACMTGLEAGMKHSLHGKKTEQPYILNILTYGGAIRRGGPKPTVVHDCLERIAIMLPPAWPAAEPRAETAYTAPPFFRPPQRQAAAFFYARKKKADTNRVAKSGHRRWRLTTILRMRRMHPFARTQGECKHEHKDLFLRIATAYKAAGAPMHSGGGIILILVQMSNFRIFPKLLVYDQF